MTVHRFTGCCAMRIRTTVAAVRLAVAAGAILIGNFAAAAPAPLEAEVQEALDAAEGGWVETIIADSRELLPYDEQIFTDISPIRDAEDAIRLPADQDLPE